MADDDLIVGYRASGHPRATGSGMRVHADGAVELSVDGGPWQRIATLTPEETARLAAATRDAGIPSLPPETPRPETMRDGTSAEWWTNLDGADVHAVIHGWADGNPAAAPSRALVMTLSRLVGTAQARGVTPPAA
jgi:hypothetical protein